MARFDKSIDVVLVVVIFIAPVAWQLISRVCELQEHANRGKDCEWKSQYLQAENEFRQAAAINEKYNNPLLRGHFLERVAYAELKQNKDIEADRDFQNALAVYEQMSKQGWHPFPKYLKQLEDDYDGLLRSQHRMTEAANLAEKIRLLQVQ